MSDASVILVGHQNGLVDLIILIPPNSLALEFYFRLILQRHWNETHLNLHNYQEALSFLALAFR